MENISNKLENFVREIRNIEIYQSSALSFSDNMKGNLPNADDLQYVFKVNPEDFERKLPTKRQDGNNYFEVDVNFPLLAMTKTNRESLYEKFNRKGFCVVLVSNTESMVLGNDREPLGIDFLDAIKDNASGNDQFNISVTGKTIIPPKIV